MEVKSKKFYQFFCPICKKSIEWQGNPFRPFCSDRCRMIDLGQWAQEGYRIPGKKVDLDESENPSHNTHDNDGET